MKNYNYAMPFLWAALCASPLAQATHVSNHAAPSAAQSHTVALMASRPGQAHQFVDADPTPSARGSGAVTGRMPPAGALSQVAAQNYAGGPVAAAHTSPGKSGLANTQAAAERIAEPASEMLLLIALSALAIAVRRQSPT